MASNVWRSLLALEARRSRLAENRQGRFVIGGEVTIRGVDGVADFSAQHSRKQDYVVQLYAFGIMALDGRLPLSMRKTNLDRLLRGHLQKFDDVIARGEPKAGTPPRRPATKLNPRCERSLYLSSLAISRADSAGIP